MPSARCRQLVLGAIEGYAWEQIAPFFETLRACGYAGAVVIFHRSIGAPTLQELRARGVRLCPLPPRGWKNPWTGHRHVGEGRLGRALQMLGRGLRPIPGGSVFWQAVAQRFFHIANLRFLLAHDYLEQHAAEYDQVLLTDVRDVIFQAAPFDPPYTGELCTFLEDGAMTLRTDRNYRDWLEAEFGCVAVAPFQDARISCCGLTLGPTAAMRRYLAAMRLLLLGSSTAQPFRFGLDSSAHNHLLWHRLLPELQVRETFRGSTATLGGVPANHPALTSQGPLRNENGTVIPILHQYDRHPARFTSPPRID